MLVLDIETSGLNSKNCGIISIGALCLENLSEEFYEEARLDEEDVIEKDAIKINGFSEEEMRNEKKQNQKEMLEKFLKWVEKQKIKMIIGQNVGFFDLNFIKNKIDKYKLEFKTRFRSLDLCTIAQMKYFQIHERFLFDELGENAMNLTKILEFCGLEDKRIRIKDGEIKKDGTKHNALEDCKLEAECFSRLVYDKNLFPEYSEYKIPMELAK